MTQYCYSSNCALTQNNMILWCHRHMPFWRCQLQDSRRLVRCSMHHNPSGRSILLPNIPLNMISVLQDMLLNHLPLSLLQHNTTYRSLQWNLFTILLDWDRVLDIHQMSLEYHIVHCGIDRSTFTHDKTLHWKEDI